MMMEKVQWKYFLFALWPATNGHHKMKGQIAERGYLAPTMVELLEAKLMIQKLYVHTIP